MSQFQRKVLAKSLRMAQTDRNQGDRLLDSGLRPNHEPVPIDSLLWEWGAQIAALSEDFPLLKDICKGLKKNQYPAALFVGGGLLMTLMTRCTYRFYHRPEELRRLNMAASIAQ